LCELEGGQEADFFAQLAEKQELTTRDGKPYFRVSFRDAKRVIVFPIWADSGHATACRNEWAVGRFYKLRAKLRSTNFGPQLEIRQIRPVKDGDDADGYDPQMCMHSSRFEPEQMFAELVAIAKERIENEPLRRLVVDLLEENRERLLLLPAATRNHDAVVSGFLEHVLNVARTACYLADKYAGLYADLRPPIDKDLVVAGAILHDIGKLRELALGPAGAEFTAAGSLIGHVLQGRDMVREAAVGQSIEPETLLRLEQLIVAHQRLPEWGAPKPPMTPEALIVHYADDLDAKLHMMVTTIEEDATDGLVTSKRNVLGHEIYRGGV
jgi:3'-5' exoribonuclease